LVSCPTFTETNCLAMIHRVVTLVTWVVLLQRGGGYSTGGPREACSSLQPGHGGQAGDLEDIPYQLVVEPSTIMAGSNISITLLGTGWITRYEFKGFLLQVRGYDGSSLGTFHTSDVEAVYLHCHHKQDTVTHSSSQPKTSLTISWSAPSQLSGQVQVIATVVQDFSTYWVGLTSVKVTVRGREKQGMLPDNHAESGLEPEPKRKPKLPVYNGCSVTKTCFGVPNGCEVDGDCSMLSSWVVEGNITVIELYSNSGHGRYVALALSEDQNMGDDFVLSCTGEGGKPKLEHSWNSGKSNKMLGEVEGTVMVEGSMQDGGDLYCKVERNIWIEGYPPMAGSAQFLYQLDKMKSHLLISGGSYSSSLLYHGPGMAQATTEKVDMKKVSSVRPTTNILMKAHGVLMVVAWLGCAGSGIVLARYFKDTWKDSPSCGQAQWFLWHRFLMLVVWVATISGIVCIALEQGGWTYNLQDIIINPHPVLGVAAFILTFIQPFISLCRPSPASSARWIFNWTHWFVGNSAHVIAIMAIFFAIELSKAQLERTVTWVIVAYVVFHVGCHLVFSINLCWAETNSRSDIYPLSGRVSENSGYIEDIYLTKDKRGGSCRKFCFGLYFVITWSLTVLVVMMIVVVPGGLTGGKHDGHSHQHQEEHHGDQA